MPNATFFNIDEEKQEKIISAAMKEFSAETYSNASIARIIKKAGIPRGSFYQYFEGIEDLYRYVLQIIADEKMAYLNPVLTLMEEGETFEILKGLYRAGIQFAKDHPKYAGIGNQLFKEKKAVRDQVTEGLTEKSIAFYEMIFQRGRDRGDIDPKADIQTAAYMAHILNLNLADSVLEGKENQNLMDHVEEYYERVEKMLYIFQEGLQNKKA
ncbi:TetR/AcrR family transcriptional regulator [Isachenkonia alkalipeptolytica]|uniref:TetR/AcrR family transcriptional regulator n=1 Tax=Isachenkonia alkalipeptolytica TaxID=2565777 RepID=A0AA43XKR1_9CLOT|nr:TetR/AcrR family transcriptional regulator [Isachenkonia alkalipeptolytica]NBG87650.1 TetR/AcrR family transcriptional regulator [Isachenkonia alkalipeptolytica]